MAVAQRTYARALFEAARGAGRLDAVRRDLAAFSEAVEENDALARFLTNPQVDPAAKADVLDELAGGGDDLLRNFLRLLAQKGRAGEIPTIREELEALVDLEQGRIAVELTTAHPLSDEEADALVQRIERASGRSVEATRDVDPNLIGGLVLRVGSLRVDASVRGRLERLRRELAATT